METVAKLLSIEEVRDILGVSRQTVLRLVRRGELSPVRIGEGTNRDRRLFEPSDIREFIDSHKECRSRGATA